MVTSRSLVSGAVVSQEPIDTQTEPRNPDLRQTFALRTSPILNEDGIHIRPSYVVEPVVARLAIAI